jgi:hypothetical protein
MLHLYLTGRRRAFELAVLEVFGARRRDLWGPVPVEQGSLVGYGVLCGGLVGLLVARRGGRNVVDGVSLEVDLCDRVVRLVDGRPAEPTPPPATDEGGGPVA